MKVLLALVVAVAVQIPCVFAGDTGGSLYFIVIHERQFENSTPIKVDELGIDGFCAAKPDLEISKIEEVTMRHDKQKTRIDREGVPPAEGIDDVFRVFVQLGEEAQKGFARVSADAIGNRILIQVGDQPVLAPVVHTKIDTPSLVITLHEEEAAMNIVKTLRKLTVANADSGPRD